jgi:hypothetical protein
MSRMRAKSTEGALNATKACRIVALLQAVAMVTDAFVQGGDKAGHRIVGAVLTRAVQNPSTV